MPWSGSGRAPSPTTVPSSKWQRTWWPGGCALMPPAVRTTRSRDRGLPGQGSSPGMGAGGAGGHACRLALASATGTETSRLPSAGDNRLERRPRPYRSTA